MMFFVVVLALWKNLNDAKRLLIFVLIVVFLSPL